MRAVVQRVSSASVAIDGNVAARIERGLLILLGVQAGDTAADVEWLAPKLAQLRIFEDAAGKMNLSLLDLAASTAGPSVAQVLVVSQFTLLGSTRKGNRPSFNDAARPEVAIPLYEAFVRTLERLTGRPVPTGIFGAMMQVALVNDGPVTLVVDSRLRE